jgi:OOP family OmpA-OmpF porin
LKIITFLCVSVLGVGAGIAPSVAASRVQSLESYRLLTLTSAHFVAASLDLSADEKTALGDLAKRVCHTDETVVELRGYADGAGSTKKDVALSAERARAVERFLIERGVPADRIILLGLGEVDPNGPAFRAEHQRVDVRVFEQ